MCGEFIFLLNSPHFVFMQLFQRTLLNIVNFIQNGVFGSDFDIRNKSEKNCDIINENYLTKENFGHEKIISTCFDIVNRAK